MSTQKQTLFDHTGIGLLSNVMLTPFRACLNSAAETLHPGQTLRAFTLRGAPTNIARGTAAITLQTYNKNQIEQLFGANYRYAELMGNVSAALTGTFVGSTFEMLYIRKQAGLTGMRFSFALTSMILLRETGFVAYVFTDPKQLTSLQTYALNFTTTAFTAYCHRKIVPLAKAAPQDSLFSFKTASSGLTKSPAVRIASAANILFFRFAYLESCKQIMTFNREEVWPKIKSSR